MGDFNGGLAVAALARFPVIVHHIRERFQCGFGFRVFQYANPTKVSHSIAARPRKAGAVDAFSLYSSVLRQTQREDRKHIKKIRPLKLPLLIAGGGSCAFFFSGFMVHQTAEKYTIKVMPSVE